MSKSRNNVRRNSRGAFGGLESLEQRALFAVTLPTGVATALPNVTSIPRAGSVTTTLPVGGGATSTPSSTDAGGTTGTAANVVLPVMTRVTRQDDLASAADVDMFKVTLNQGDFLSVDIDATGVTALASTLSVVNINNVAQPVTMIGTEPETGLAGGDKQLGFWAPGNGEYFVKVGTTGTTGRGRSYNLNLERIGMSYSAGTDALAQDGAFHAWLNQAGTTLNIAGPKGYGFSLRGTWATSQNHNVVTYSTTSTMYLSTPYLQGSIGEIALQPGSGGFSVKADAVSGWRPLGKLTGTTGQFGLSLAPIAGPIEQATGFDVSARGIMNKWTIMTGENVRDHFEAMQIEQVLDGVPYLVYEGGNVGTVVAKFGDVRLTNGNLNTTVMIAEPADPYVFVNYGAYAAGASFKGRIPFNNEVGPDTFSNDVGNSDHRGDQYYGHAFVHADIPLAQLPITLHGNVTVDLDANKDGVLLGNAAKAADLFSSGAPWTALAHDINLGVEGSGDLGYAYAGYDLAAEVAEGSLLYDGPKQGVWFNTSSGTPDIWKDTPAESFKTGASSETELYGYIYMDGRLSVTAHSNYTVDVLGSTVLQADASVNVTSNGTIASTVFTADGLVDTPIGSASVAGTFYTDGNFFMEGDIDVHIGDNTNYIDGNAYVSFAKTGSTYKFHADGELDVRARVHAGVAELRARGTVDGWIDLTWATSGFHYNLGMNFDVDVEVYDGVIDHRWEDWYSDSGGVELENGKLKLKTDEATFSINLN